MKQRASNSKLKKSVYVEGFLAGQAVAYCEQVRLEIRLAGQIVVPIAALRTLLPLVAREGCKAATQQINGERASLLIYKDARAKSLFNSLQSAPLSKVAIWGMGKLFGYADRKILGFIETAT